MGKLFLFWMSAPSGDILYDRWAPFKDQIALVLIVIVAIVAAATIYFYARAARARKIGRPSDLFGPYTPTWWLCFAAVAGIVMFAWYGWQFRQQFHDSERYWVQGSVEVGAWAAAIAAAAAYLGFLFVTPAKFKYRIWRP